MHLERNAWIMKLEKNLWIPFIILIGISNFFENIWLYVLILQWEHNAADSVL